MVLFLGEDRFYIAQETLEGELIRESRGSGGFGYDPILYIPEKGRTVAELTEEEKNTLSHRGKAGRIIAKLLAEATGEKPERGPYSGTAPATAIV
jgi:XTP/dITP diphosphohydrolase